MDQSNRHLPRIIAIEGLDGTGKESVSKKLMELLYNKGFEAKVISFPRYDTHVGQVIDEYQKGYFSDPTTTDPFIAGALYTFDRREYFKRLSTESGFIYSHGVEIQDLNWFRRLDFLIMDRSYFSNYLYQGPKFNVEVTGNYSRLLDWMRINYYAEIEANTVLKESLFKVYFLEVSEEHRQEQIKNRKELDLNESNLNYQKALREFFYFSRSYDFWKGLRSTDYPWVSYDLLQNLEEFYYRKVMRIESVFTQDRAKIPEAVSATGTKILNDLLKNVESSDVTNPNLEVD
jgi:dTMP kinase